MENLVGKKYTFEDGMTIEVIQIKNRELNEEFVPVVTYHTYGARTVPRKLVMAYTEFEDNFGHLFGLRDKY